MQLSPYMLNVPHALAMAHDKNLICVADRENGRVLCYNMDGKIVRVMQPPEFGSTIYSVAYCEQKGDYKAYENPKRYLRISFANIKHKAPEIN